MSSCTCGTPAKYRCKCGVRYCLVACYKAHDHLEAGAAAAAATTNSDDIASQPLSQSGSLPQQPQQPQPSPLSTDNSETASAFAQSLPQDIVDKLKLPTLQFHLHTLLEIINRPITDLPGRQFDVAKLKLTALREGGTEANAEVEEFVDAVLSHLNQQKEDL